MQAVYSFKLSHWDVLEKAEYCWPKQHVETVFVYLCTDVFFSKCLFERLVFSFGVLKLLRGMIIKETDRHLFSS